MPPDSKSPQSTASFLWLLIACAATAGWLWVNLCRFPVSPWNDVRLAPVFMAAQGVPVYTLPDAGILTTWMYGPVPLWVWWPATFARDVAGAVMTAGAINLLATVAAVIATCRWWPAPGATRNLRGFAVVISLALWPDHAFRFLQADNVAVALGLMANLLLVTARPGESPGRTWLAALATAAALGCKQTTLGLVVAQAVWLGWAQGRSALVAHLARTLIAGGILLAAAVTQFGGRELWFGLVTVPQALPPVEDIGARLLTMAPHLAFQAALPLAVLLVLGRRVLERNHPLGLPAAAFLASLPLGFAGMLSTGGTINSFQGYAFLLPALALHGLARLPSARPALPSFLAAATALVVTARITLADFAPVRPATGELAFATGLHAGQPGAVWLPWNPLVTYFAEGRFDHAEDGIYVRFITGHPVSRTHADAGLPPHMRMIAFPSPEMQWGVAAKLAPAGARVEQRDGWLIVTWP